MEDQKLRDIHFAEAEIPIPDRHERPRVYRQPTSVATGLILAAFLYLLCSDFPDLWSPSRRWGRLLEKPMKESLVDFSDITPSEKLEWHPCFAEQPAFKCARLTVPMDYHRPLNESGDNPKVHVAMILIPGKHDGPNKFSTSPLLLNPGGPGGSGVAFGLGFGENIQKVVGKNQDVIGFDPRGIGATTPRADCFSHGLDEDLSTESGEDYAQSNFHRQLWQVAGRELGDANSSSGSLKMLNARAKSLAKLCQEKDSIRGKDSIFKYVNTPNVARDMLSIVDAWDEWTDSLSSSCGHRNSQDIPNADESQQSQPDTNLDTKGKLVYWGFSYGTLLGATFAAMFPDRVGRVVLDGVVDADHYVAPVWVDSLRDTDTIYRSFPKYCYEAKKSCFLYRPGDELSDIEDRFFGTLDDLRENPITITDQYSKIPVLITYSDIKRIIFTILYAPVVGFPILATIFNLIVEGEVQVLAPSFAPSAPFEIFPVCEEPRPAWQYPNEAQAAIMCSDKRYPLNETVPDLEKRLGKMTNLSSFADIWFTVMLGCEEWGIHARDGPMRWDDHPIHKQKPINTSFPVLFVGNTFDPVTPLWAGVKMAKKFRDAGLIEQKSMGHCSVAAVSFCTIGKIRSYFTKGEVPPPPKEGGKGRELEDGQWDRCSADEWPFHPYDSSEFIATNCGNSAKEAEAMDAFKEMQGIFAEMKHWGQPSALKGSGLIGLQV